MNWPNSPTIYPPGAELLFWLVNEVAPLNITAMQLAMAACDASVGVATLLLLRHYRLDPRRFIVYWWNPIPILEFTYSAHVDAAATLFVLVAFLLALQRWRWSAAASWSRFRHGGPDKALSVALCRGASTAARLGIPGLDSASRWCWSRCRLFTLVLETEGFLTTYFSQRFVDQGITLPG